MAHKTFLKARSRDEEWEWEKRQPAFLYGKLARHWKWALLLLITLVMLVYLILIIVVSGS